MTSEERHEARYRRRMAERQRRREELKKFRRWVDEGTLTREDCPHGIRELARPHEAREQLEGAAEDGQVLSEALRERETGGTTMYEIRKDGALLALTDSKLHPPACGRLLPCCARRQRHRAWRYRETPYHLMGRDEMPECETVVVQETDAGRVLLEEQTKAAAETRLTDQMQVAVKAYVRATTDITDAEALAMPDMFRTWEEVLEAGKALEANTVLRIGRQLYRVVQQVTPQAHQRPDGEGMLAVYRPIDQSHAGTLEDPVPSSTAWTRRRESITATAGRSTCATRTWPRACGRLTRRGCGSGRKPMPLLRPWRACAG